MVSAEEIVALQDRRTEQWHERPVAGLDGASSNSDFENADQQKAREDWLEAVARQHRANYDLWHIEDEARAPGAADAELASVKRRIDVTNQLRNDLVEELDRVLLGWLEARGLPNPAAPMHSETPGLIIDRLSILSLKIYHTREEAERKNAPAGHDVRNLERLAVLEKQRRDLAGCLDVLWREIQSGTQRFELYRQMKMYNDPSLNPAIYGRTGASRGQ